MIMDKIIVSNRILRLLFLQTIFVIAINSQYITQTINSSIPVTADVPNYIKAVIREEGKPSINLLWTRTEEIVANRHLPVWGAQCGDIHDSKTEMADPILSTFVMYHDFEKNSAIVYVKYKNQIYGYVDSSYFINGFTVKNVGKKLILNVGESYISRNPNGVNEKLFEYPQLPNINFSAIPTIAANNETKISRNMKFGPDKKYYLETLLFITHDVIENVQLEHPSTYLYYILLKYIVYFNGVDMLLAKLPVDFRIHINLAGIIFEEDRDVFSSITGSSIFDYTEQKSSLDMEDFGHIFSNYFLSDPDFVFDSDSFDHIFVSTSRELKFKNIARQGLSIVGADIYKLRQLREHEMLGIPMTIVRNVDVFQSYVVAAHEISRVFGNVQDITSPKRMELEDTKCDSLDEPSPIPHNSTNWHPKAVHTIKKFIKEQKNVCWFLNSPRSLRPKKTIDVQIVASRQCTCYGYITYGQDPSVFVKHVPYYACGLPLQCLKKQGNDYVRISTILPLDGTPCKEDYSKVCWKKQCVDVSTY